MEFEEIRPYHDEELPQIFEELIADPAFQQVACAVMPGVPFEPIPMCPITGTSFSTPVSCLFFWWSRGWIP